MNYIESACLRHFGASPDFISYAEDGPLLEERKLLSTSIQAYDSGHMKKFVRWISLFGGLGVLIPLVLLIRFWVFHHPFGAFEAKLWPGSGILVGLDAPNPPLLDVVLFYGVAFVGNAFLYAIIGVFTWPLDYLVLRRRAAHS